MILQVFTHPGQAYRNSAPHTRYCHNTSCGKFTWEGKDYCTEHVDEHPYVQKLLAQIKAKSDETKKVAKLGKIAVKPDSETLKEIRVFLRFNGPRTIRRLSRETRLGFDIVSGYVNYLKDQNEVILGTTPRGDSVVSNVEG